MKRVLIFIGLKIVEIIGFLVVYGILWLPTVWLHGATPPKIARVVGIISGVYVVCYFCAVIWKKMPQKWFKANWEWAGKLSRKK